MHVWHMHHLDDFKPLFEFLARPKIPYGSYPKIHHDTNIPIPTLKTYRTHLLQDPNYLPYQNLGVTTIPTEEEQRFAETLRNDFIHMNKPLSLGDMQDMAVDLYSRLDANVVHRDSFSASYSWAVRFMRDYRFSLRCGHNGRRGVIDPTYVGKYIAKIRNARRKYSHDLIYNMDETCVHTSNAPRHTIGIVGSDSVPQGDNGIEKECFTSIATITYSGMVLPLWFFGKGQRESCTNCFPAEYELEQEIKLSYSTKGWTDATVMIQYLEWLHLQAGRRPCALVLDVFSAHRDKLVKETATRLNIELIYVPANGTSIYQPLDRKIFGIAKSRLLRMWEIARRQRRTCIVWNKKQAAIAMVQIMTDLNNSASVRNAWLKIPELESRRYDDFYFPAEDEPENEDVENWGVDYIGEEE